MACCIKCFEMEILCSTSIGSISIYTPPTAKETDGGGGAKKTPTQKYCI